MKMVIETKVTYKSLMNKRKEELSYMILSLLDDLEKANIAVPNVEARNRLLESEVNALLSSTRIKVE